MLSILELVITWLLMGLIWTIQWVHYPMLKFTASDFKEAHLFHTQAISYLVIPPMLAELVLSIWRAWSDLTLGSFSTLPSLLLVLVIWGSTFFIQVPLHTRLATEFDPKVLRRLVQTNWIRTIAWTLKAALLAGQMLFDNPVSYPL